MNDVIELYSPNAPAVTTIAASWDSVASALWRFRGTETARGMFVASLQGTKMRRRETVFQQFGTLLQFPDYFGENWNAFKDCVSDLDWLRSNKIFLVIAHAELLLLDGDPDELSLFVNILGEAANALEAAPRLGEVVSLRVVLQVHPPRARELEWRLSGRAPAPDAT